MAANGPGFSPGNKRNGAPVARPEVTFGRAYIGQAALRAAWQAWPRHAVHPWQPIRSSPVAVSDGAFLDLVPHYCSRCAAIWTQPLADRGPYAYRLGAGLLGGGRRGHARSRHPGWKLGRSDDGHLYDWAAAAAGARADRHRMRLLAGSGFRTSGRRAVGQARNRSAARHVRCLHEFRAACAASARSFGRSKNPSRRPSTIVSISPA